MRKTIVTVAFVLALAGCATDSIVHATPDELPGTYYSGDGLGRNITVVLRPDGSFSSNWQGCLGVYGQAEGSWRLQGDQLLFHSASEQEMLAGYLRSATTVRHGGKLGFARAQDVERDRINERLVFTRQASGQ
ncbi:hypothetical protein [Lysobacter sp. A3-1-A15]|uniref:hypothetical protein n=1 Tax=Novilysobacter viscosus TaxID=3098602 RepID=UPI002ED9578D